MSGFMQKLVRNRHRRWARELLMVYGVDIPASVEIGRDLWLPHRGMGVVLREGTVLGDRVTIYHQVTIGRADAHVPETEGSSGVVVEDDVILFPGSKVLVGQEPIRVGRGTMLAANAVLTTSTGDWEVWAGMPARKVGERQDRETLRPADFAFDR